MSIYRDALAGLKSQVATKRAVVASREQVLSPVLRALLPERFRTRLAELHPRALTEGDSMESLSKAEAALDGILAVHDEVERLRPKLRESPDEVVDPAPPAMNPPWLIEDAALVGFREAIRVRLQQIAPDAYLARFGDFAYIARFAIAHAPYKLVANATVSPDVGGVTRYELVLRTSVPEALPSLVLQVQGLQHALGKALHVTRAIEIGDPTFDARFWITGAARAGAVLTRPVRGALERLVAGDPVLRLGNGMATLSWSGRWQLAPLHAVLPVAAFEVLAGIRLAIETA